MVILSDGLADRGVVQQSGIISRMILDGDLYDREDRSLNRFIQRMGKHRESQEYPCLLGTRLTELLSTILEEYSRLTRRAQEPA